MALDQSDVDRIADQLSTCLIDARRAKWVDPETHSQHHEWAALRIASEQELKQLKRKIIESAAIWAVPLILIFVATAIWHEFVASILKHMAK